MKCTYLLYSLELSRKGYLHEVLDKEYPKELVSEIEGILVTPVECELSGGSLVAGFRREQTFTFKHLCDNLCLVGFEGNPFWTRICVPPRDKLWFTADLYKVPYVRKPDSQVLNLNFEALKASFVAIWVVERTLALTLDSMFEKGYDLVHIIEWVKLAPSGRIRASLGYYFQHSAESLLIFVKRKECTSSLVVEKVEGLRKEKAIFADRLVEGVKPRKVYEMFGKVFDNRHLKVELFARCANLKSGWIQIGLEVDPLVSDKAFGCFVPKGLPNEKASE
eukprot:augustus_masked-scaffold_6-processed-gene-8.41-mRNA-1 protein AED:1.00 eAED:1.00 QI:0/0/0/0/1/1/2/0/277